MSLTHKPRLFTLAVFGAFMVAQAQPVFAQKSYQTYSLAQTFSSNVFGLGGIAANGTFLAYIHGDSALLSRNGSSLPLAGPPGVVDFYYLAVNASLTTVGTGYLEDGSDTAAFVREADGKFRFLSFPPNSFPQPTAINNNGDVVGSYYDQDGNGQGFIANAKGLIDRIDVPGATYVQPLGINASGVVVGYYADENGGSHSFIRDGKGAREWTLPGGLRADANCINNNGTIGGYYSDGTNIHGFVSKGGKVTTIDYQDPDSPASYTRIIGGNPVLFVKVSSYPTISGINDRGDFVGYTWNVYRPTDPNINFLNAFQKSFWGTPH